MRCITIALIVLLLPVSVARAQTERCFPETGQCISGVFRRYWETNGGLPVFGYPITAVTTETNAEGFTGPTQWFERDRLEDHRVEGKGILAGRLGVVRFKQLYGTEWNELPADNAIQPGCRLFRETYFNLCDPFLSYWRRNGGLERFGYPITRQRQETVEGREYTVQYFERRRMEVHPENQPPFNILLGLLGNEVRSGGTTTSP